MDSVTAVSIFVASPGDVSRERELIQEIVDELNTIGVADGKIILNLKLWETHAWPGFGIDGQDVINSQIGEYDIFIGLMWNRLGTPTGRAKSGTVEEFERAYEKWKAFRRPALMFYFNSAPTTLKTVSETRQRELVLRFQASLKRLGALCWDYKGPAKFARQFRIHLNKEVQKIAAAHVRPSGSAPVPSSDPAVDHIANLSRKLGYWHTGTTRKLLTEIEETVMKSNSAPVRDAAAAAILNFLNNALFEDNDAATKSAREVRRLAFNTLRACSQGELRRFIAAGELESLDLFAFDFSHQDLHEINMRTAFLLEADFSGSNLNGASLRDSWVRNADFSQASLNDTDLTGADWFNAVHLKKSQVERVRPGTLMMPPANIEGMFDYLKIRYRLPFESWREDIRKSLVDAWHEYLRPGGLCEFVSRR